MSNQNQNETDATKVILGAVILISIVTLAAIIILVGCVLTGDIILQIVQVFLNEFAVEYLVPTGSNTVSATLGVIFWGFVFPAGCLLWKNVLKPN